MCAAQTLFDKVWDSHVIARRDDGESLVFIDYNIISEGAFYAFDGLRNKGRTLRRPAQTLAFADHYVPTTRRHLGIDSVADAEARMMIEQLERNTRHFGVRHHGIDHPMQGIMHVVPAELGAIQPGMIVTGADSHIATDGAFGAAGFGVGASQVEHVFTTQALWLRKPRTMRITVDGRLGTGVSGKDVILAIISEIGIAGGIGYALEYAGGSIRSLGMEGRMTLCNMSIEAGAQVGMVAPDEVTYSYLKGRELAPADAHWNAAVEYWKSLPSDTGARFDREVSIDGAKIEPMVTWGTCQEEAGPITGSIPDPRSFADAERRRRVEKALAYMGLAPGMVLRDIAIDRVFIGSCTNSRLDDLRAAAAVARGRKAKIPAVIVPGSRTIQRAAEQEGLHEIFRSAGFEWRDPGCSMCIGANGDRVPAGERCASTSNRNFEGRQGRGARTHLVSPAMAAAAAINGRLSDVREFI